MRRAFTRSAAIISALVMAAISVASSSSAAASRTEGTERAGLEDRIKGDREDFAGSASGVMVSNLRESIWKAAASTTEPHRIRYSFQSHFWDGDVGLYHMRARMFDPRSGTLLSRDPSRYVDSVKLYAPMRRDVVNLSDPTGEAVFIAEDEPDAARPPGHRYVLRSGLISGMCEYWIWV